MLTVQIGQCGNQLGRALFDRLAAEDPASASPFFRPPETASSLSSSSSTSRRVARAVLIDMEPRVIQRLTHGPGPGPSSMGAWAYDPTNVFTAHSGSGNNWAHGFMVHGEQHEDALLDLLQREAERCDAIRGVLVLQSVAGGTGAGVGSYLTERLLGGAEGLGRGGGHVLNAAVWPHMSGEVIVQNYNAVLTLASLQDGPCEGIVALQNDVAAAICRRLLGIPRPSFEAMNDVLATQLASALTAVEGDHSSSRRTKYPLADLCEGLCVHPGYKLLDLKMIPQMPPRSKAFSTHTWTGLLKHLRQMQVANCPLEEGIDWQAREGAHRALGSVLVLRGRGALDVVDSGDLTAFRDPAMYAPWSLVPFTALATGRPFNAYDKTATLISNSTALLPTLTSTVDKAHRMFAHGAYLHPYAQHGVDDEFFQRAFLRVDQVVHNYRALL